MKRKILLSPLIIIVLIIIAGVSVAGAAVFLGGAPVRDICPDSIPIGTIPLDLHKNFKNAKFNMCSKCYLRGDLTG